MKNKYFLVFLIIGILSSIILGSCHRKSKCDCPSFSGSKPSQNKKR